MVALGDYMEHHGDLTDEQVQRMLLCEHGGMNEVPADLYALTGDRKYLDSPRFNHRQVLTVGRAKTGSRD